MDFLFYTFLNFLVDFIRRNLPENLFQVIMDGSAKKYLSSWHQESKVRTIIFQPNLPIRLHYLLIAFLHRCSVLFGYVSISNEVFLVTMILIHIVCMQICQLGKWEYQGNSMENECNEQNRYVCFIQRKRRSAILENLYALYPCQTTQRYDYKK